MSTRGRWLLLGIWLSLLLGALATLVVAYDWLTNVLLVRLAYYFWLLELAIRSRPQGLYWAMPIALGAALSVLILARHVAPRRRPQLPGPTIGRVAEWAECLELLPTSRYFNRYLRRQIARLVEQEGLLEYPPSTHGTEPSGVVLALPPGVMALLDDTETYLSTEVLETVIAYLESILEVAHER